ncbi:MAG TPA: hypothetical protein VK043_02095 [Burkholderiales bacterium]|jgi:hypothetical protein|nr:hypothetical protein [Burkholderiales bacterium]
MRCTNLIVAAVLGVAFLSGLAACGEREEVVQADRGYQGKPDGKPWDNEPLAYDTPKWQKGDQASWETQIRRRQLGQHEDRRIKQ